MVECPSRNEIIMDCGTIGRIKEYTCERFKEKRTSNNKHSQSQLLQEDDSTPWQWQTKPISLES
jgi:hypothetical protein